jgi:hypothetical protein
MKMDIFSCLVSERECVWVCVNALTQKPWTLESFFSYLVSERKCVRVCVNAKVFLVVW